MTRAPLHGTLQGALRRTCSSAGAGAAAVAEGDRIGLWYSAYRVGTDGTAGTRDEQSRRPFDEAPHGTAPFEFVVGVAGAALPGIDAGVRGMRVGERRSLVLSAADAFGERCEDPDVAQRKVLLRDLPPPLRAHCWVGARLQLPGGEQAKVVEMRGSGGGSGSGGSFSSRDLDSVLTLDTNPALAGQPLQYDVELVWTTPADSVAADARGGAVLRRTLQEGDGATFPDKAGDVVEVHYTAALAETREIFDSSTTGARDWQIGQLREPVQFPLGVGAVLPGWDEGIAAMSLGERALLRVPSSKAYGEAGAGNGIVPPNSALVFQIHLVGINGVS